MQSSPPCSRKMRVRRRRRPNRETKPFDRAGAAAPPSQLQELFGIATVNLVPNLTTRIAQPAAHDFAIGAWRRRFRTPHAQGGHSGPGLVRDVVVAGVGLFVGLAILE